MLFNSFSFLVFFIVITVAYYNINHKYRWLLLLAGSCYFYMSFIPAYILILFFTIIIDYFAGIYIEKNTGRLRKLFLYASLCANIGILAFFKYYNFFNNNLSGLLSLFHSRTPLPYSSFILPIGLSFHTFQAMSYTIEVYRGNQKAERHFGIYSLYVMFYPQLVAGPIERPQHIIHQLKKKIDYNEADVVNGLHLMLWGFLKKVVVADRLAVLVNQAYASPGAHPGFTLFVASLFFSFQIYCDFSAYSDIAVGCAKTLGIDLMKNFNLPYASKSITEFWQRWHISLSSWFRDYVYIPLGGNRRGSIITTRNILIVFLLSGLWHGANWTFIVWGLIHGILIVFERVFRLKKSNSRILNGLRVFAVFAIINFSWVFFRANSISQAFFILKSIFTNFHLNATSVADCILLMTSDNTSVDFFAVTILSLLFMLLIESRTNIVKKFTYSDNRIKQSVITICVLFITLFLGYFSNTSFIYFQF